MHLAAWTALVTLAADQPGKGNNPSAGVNVAIVIVIAALFVLAVAGWFLWQARR